ncbi:hypothetical protein [Filibacter tadaridae]|uniref:hypothetical protein n=1 Tax=Filibacter tadaridae TaxID=2483811 RepID=UPI000F5318E3|nr:hypothetical protein [Filibacter tadaridae]
MEKRSICGEKRSKNRRSDQSPWGSAQKTSQAINPHGEALKKQVKRSIPMEKRSKNKSSDQSPWRSAQKTKKAINPHTKNKSTYIGGTTYHAI